MEKIKILRDKTGVGIVDCKKALEESGGDLNKAVEILRKKGIARASKRSDREASEGKVMVVVDENYQRGYIVEINAETDFVVLSEKFQEFAIKVLETIKNNQPEDLNGLMNLPLNEGTVKEELDNLSGVFREKLQIKRYEILTGDTVAAYSHFGGKIGVLISLDKEKQKDLAYDMAMQVAAANPKYISPADVLAEEIDKEKEIYAEQIRKEGKPENIVEKIIQGKLEKYFSEICLVKQEYIKDDTKYVADILGEVKVVKFIRYSL